MSATGEDALTEAILWLKEEPADSHLSEIMFGRYADRIGFWWTMQFTRRVKNSAVEDSRQDDEKRISMVVNEWSATMATIREQNRDIQQ